METFNTICDITDLELNFAAGETRVKKAILQREGIVEGWMLEANYVNEFSTCFYILGQVIDNFKVDVKKAIERTLDAQMIKDERELAGNVNGLLEARKSHKDAKKKVGSRVKAKVQALKRAWTNQAKYYGLEIEFLYSKLSNTTSCNAAFVALDVVKEKDLSKKDQEIADLKSELEQKELILAERNKGYDLLKASYDKILELQNNQNTTLNKVGKLVEIKSTKITDIKKVING